MSETDNEIKKLDTEFNELLKHFEEFMFIYNYREKYIVTEWLTKLKNSNASVDERRLRNRFMKHFLNNQESAINVFHSEPFNNIPKDFKGPLIELKKFLPKGPDDAFNPTDDEKRAYISDLFENLYDKGEFLSQQPVPRSGTFFIIVPRPEKFTNCSRK